MYYDDNVKIKIDWKSLIIRLILIILAILLIIWLFPMPKLDVFYNKIYNENLTSMKEASENYFTSEKLPADTGSSVTLKLQDMLDKKIITSFVDKNNNECSNTNSYAQVTKTENNNYVLKVQLSCDDKTDYILENINTTNAGSVVYVNGNGNNGNGSSTNNNSGNNGNSSNVGSTSNTGSDDGIEVDQSILTSGDYKYDKDLGVTEYQYKRAITKTSTTYVCPDGYVKDNNICYKYETKDIIDATPLYFDDVKTTTQAKKNTTGGYTKKADYIKTVDKTETICPDGYTLNGSICYKYVNATVVPGTTKYTCPTGYELNGTSCTTTVEPTENRGGSSYYCPSGYTLNGNKCTITSDARRVDGETTYTCPDGFTKNGTQCTRTIDATRNVNPGSSYYTCDRGGNLNGSTCSYSATYTPGNTTCRCPDGYSESGGSCVKKSSYPATYHQGTTSYGNCPSGYSVSGNGSTCTATTTYAASKNVSWSNPTVTKSSKQLSEYNNGTEKRVLASHSCSLAGCTYVYYTYKAQIAYSCPYGGNRNGEYCYITNTVARPTTTTNGYYTCSDGSSPSGSTCYSTSYANKNCNTTEGTYSCPNGGNRNGSTCTYQATYHKNDDQETYTCPSDYTKNGTRCTKTVSATVTRGETTYICPDDYVKNGTKCTKTIDASEKPGDVSYSCPAGFTLSGNTCTKTIAATAETTKTEYTCPTGYVQEGTTCYQYTEPTTKTTYKYSCPTGFTKSGEGEQTKCTKEVKEKTTYYCEHDDETLVDDKCIKTTKGGLKGYSCPEGYLLNKKKCVKKTLECATPNEVTNTSVSYEYRWSTETYLSGWTQTGKTRTIQNNQSESSNVSYEK